MDPTTTFCPNLACPARGETGQGTIGIHSRKDRRFICTQCRKTFAATHGTVFYRLRTSADLVALIITLLAHGCPVQAIVVAFGFDERTVTAWGARAGRHGQTVQEHLVEQPRALGQVQADEIRVKRQGGIVWMALAMMVSTRLWLAGEVSEPRDMTLMRRVIERVRAWPSSARCCSVPMACAPIYARFARPFATQCGQEPTGGLACARGATSASPRSSSAMRSDGGSTSSAASWRAHRHGWRRCDVARKERV